MHAQCEKDSMPIISQDFSHKRFIIFAKTLATSVACVSKLQKKGQGLTVVKGQAPSCYFSQIDFPIPKDKPSGQQAVD